MNNYARLTLAWLVGTAAWPLAAQTAAPASKAVDNSAQTVAVAPAAVETASAEESENVIRLSPFEVTSVKDTGYQATETLAGTRIRTQMKDVSAAISIVTKEFLQDVGATDSGTLLQYTTNAEVAGTKSTYAGLGNGTSVDESGNLRAPAGAQRVRGVAAADNARDYYITDIPWDSFNVDRIDILRGPNSILFGLGSPAGIVNGSTRNAEFRNRGEVTARYGSYGSARGTIDVNQELISKVLAIRLDGVWSNEKYEQTAAYQDTKRIYGALRFDPQIFKDRSFHTSIKAKLENGNIKANRPRTTPPQDSITPWYRPVAISAANPFGGMGRVTLANPYDPFRTDSVNPSNSRGAANTTTANYQPWLGDVANQQQPVYTIDGLTNQLYKVDGGYVNTFARNSSGGFTGSSNGLVGKRQNGMLWGLNGSLSGVVNNYNNSTAYANSFPTARFGQYRTQSLLDPTVFDFYKTLIDGPTKSEFEKWTAYNINISQTAFDDRLGAEWAYDRQKYKNGAQQLIGGAPTLTVDITQNFTDFVAVPGSGGINNPNLGRPFVQGANNNGGRSYYTDREYRRFSLFGELRASDFLSNSFLVKLLGKHRFNAVGANEKVFNENRTWQLYANSQEWVGYWNGNAGNTLGIGERAPVAVIYLGSSVLNRTSASGAHIPGIGTNVTLPDHGVYVFDPTWRNPTGINFGDTWNVPTSLWPVFSGMPDTTTTQQLYQVSNPDNLNGWNYNFQNPLGRSDWGDNQSMLRSAQKSLRETSSYSGSYQGYLWNNALVATLGWRYDQVKTKDKTAAGVANARGMLNMNPDVYTIEGGYPANQIVKGHSTSGGAVLHLNQILPRDPLPIDVTVGYNESSNFQVTSVRRDLYGVPTGNPSGKTYEYSILLATKDGKYSFRAVDFTMRTKNGNSSLSNSGGIGATIQQGLKWRNVFLYQLGVYDWGSRNQDSYRNRWTNAYPALDQATADAQLDQAITGWNDIQRYLNARGFFQAWNFTPTTESVLTTRSAYLANPAAFAPDPNTVTGYVASTPQGFAVTADTESKGNEFEFTANPLPNWRISFNASKTTASQKNIGGETLAAFVTYINSKLTNPDGSFTPAGGLPQFGGAGSSILISYWAPFVANYTQLRLQEGTAMPEIRKWRYNVVSNYSFRTGLLKGVGVGGAYRWQDKSVIGYPMLATGQFALNTAYYGPAEDGIDLWASYERKLSSKINWKIQLNVRNAFAKHGLIPLSIEPDGNTWAAVRTKPIQEWFVTNTLSF